MAHHEVTNQVPPLLDYDMAAGDAALLEALRREGGAWGEDEVRAFGQLTGSATLLEHGRLANEHPPILRAFAPTGERINWVEFHPSWHALMAASMAHGLHNGPWASDRPGRYVVRSAKSLLMGQVEAGHGCPITMTFAAVPALRNQPGLAAVWEPRITGAEYDPRNIPADGKTACTAGMAMTEKQGGSDVRANTTRAEPTDDGSYRLYGHKWFCSAPQCDVFLTLAYVDRALTCFLVPRWTPDGRPNAMNVQRLKDKLGNRSNASSEIEYDGAYAVRVGEEGRGVPTIIEMVSHTRLDCVVGSAALMRQVTTRAIHHATHRRAFKRTLIDQPLMQNVLADLSLEVEASVALGLRLARAYEEGIDDPSARAFARIATAIGKYQVCKRCPETAYEAMECLGGNGYAEEHQMARHYREAPLNSIWEGSGNVICLDVLRAAQREPETLPALEAELAAALGEDARYDAHIAMLKREMGDLITDPDAAQAGARRLVEGLAIALQAGLLIRHAPSAVADAFVTSRIERPHAHFGTLPRGTDFRAIIDRSDPAVA